MQEKEVDGWEGCEGGRGRVREGEMGMRRGWRREAYIRRYVEA